MVFYLFEAQTIQDCIIHIRLFCRDKIMFYAYNKSRPFNSILYNMLIKSEEHSFVHACNNAQNPQILYSQYSDYYNIHFGYYTKLLIVSIKLSKIFRYLDTYGIYTYLSNKDQFHNCNR